MHEYKMGYFVLAGKRKVTLNQKYFSSLELLGPDQALEPIGWSSLGQSLKNFIDRNQSHFSGKRIGVVIPDPTRDFHPRKTLRTLGEALKRQASRTEFIIALGLHRRLSPKALEAFLGRDFLGENRVYQHNLSSARPLGAVSGVPVSFNPRLLSYDVFFTVGVVEPHLYGGFSGGVKGIAIGLAGKETILKTHSVAYLSQAAVRAGNIGTNPFQRFLWGAVAQLDRPVYSINLVNNGKKEMVGYTVGKARPAFREAVAIARNVFACPVEGEFDALLVGCDYPKDQSLYQSSRLFNYLLEGKRLLRRGGAIVVFAGLKDSWKSQAEKNFEAALRRKSLPAWYAFAKPGEHRAFKVLDAAHSARLCLVTANPPEGTMSALTVLPNQRAACKWIDETYGAAARIGVIPAGFSFLAV